MKKLLVVIVSIFVFSTACAEVEYNAHLVAKACVKEPNGYFILSDGSYWKVVGFIKRTRGLSEWWNGVELAPEAYNCMPKDWAIGAPVTMHLKQGNLGTHESNASNQETLKKCSHLLVNQGNGLVLFAQPLDAATFLEQVSGDAHQNGYNKAYNVGYIEGSSYRSQENDRKYKEGQTEGYARGYTRGQEEATKTAYAKGYNTGYTEGYGFGYSDGGEGRDKKPFPKR